MAGLRSMTGFGAATAERDGISARVEIRTVNHRSLKLGVRARPSLGEFEKDLRDRVGGVLLRGSVDVTIQLRRPPEVAISPEQTESARAAVEALRRLAAAAGLRDDLAASDLAAVPGLLEESLDRPLIAAEWAIAAGALDLALRQVDAMRAAEGAALGRVLEAHLADLEAYEAASRVAAPQVVERARARLVARIAELRAGNPAALDAQAIEREVCFFADRADIHEELDRLRSHVAQFREALRGGGEAGKRLEFLAQEFLREINTSASKANDAAIAAGAVRAKLAVEKIKEQAANVE